MTDEQRFTEVVARTMGKCVHSFSIEVRTSEGNFDWFKCDKCGMSEGDLTGDYEDFNPITPEGELTPECRKWLAENLPDVWEKYVSHFMICYNYAEGEDLNKIADTIFTRMLSVTLSAENLWKWMRENTDSWLMEPCMPCSGVGGSRLPDDEEDYDLCPECNGTGRVAKWDVKKWLEGK